MFRTRHRHLRAILRDDPSDTGTPNPGGGGGATPPVPTPPPAEFDPSTLPPEARKWHEAQLKAADEKARTGTRDNAAKAERDKLLAEFAKTLGLAPAEVDPQAMAAELAQRRSSEALLRAELAIGKACRKTEIGADEDLVTAYLAREGKLSALDPADKGYAAAVEKLVTEAVAAKPAMKLAPVATPPGGRVPPAAGTFNRPAGGEGSPRPTMHDALTQFYAQQAPGQ